MQKTFNVTGVCVPTKHYMVDISRQLCQIQELVKQGAYFTINRARQYGKTTTLYALAKLLSDDYLVVSLDFQALDTAKHPRRTRASLLQADIRLWPAIRQS